MAIKVMKELNPYFEIMGLLYDSQHPENMEEEVWKKAAKDRGLEPEEIMKKIGGITRKYHSVFQKYMKGREMEDFDFFFSESEPEFVLFFQSVCGEHREWMEEELEDSSREEIQKSFLQEFTEEEKITQTPTLEKMMEILEQAGYSGALSWKFLLFLQSPVEKLRNLSRIVRENYPAFLKAQEAVKKQLDKLIEEFQKGMEKGYLIMKISGEGVAYPVLICPGSQIINSNLNMTMVYVGLFVKDIYELLEKGKNSRKHLLPALKALSDSSKFEILQSLLVAPKYNLELAEELKLTPPTVSHHMNTLLDNGLVNVEKKEGKVYYTLSKDSLRDIIKELENIFMLR